MLLVGLTGGVACGKSSALRHLAELGCYPIDADRIARQVVEPDEPAFAEIVDTFGEEFLNSVGEINREKLGNLIFRDAEARQRLNEIVHPRVLAEESRRIEEIRAEHTEPSGFAAIVVDAALMVEVGSYKRYDVLLVVYCPRRMQIQRLMRSRDFNREEALRRIDSQMPTLEKVVSADYVIDSSGPLRETHAQIEHIWHDLRFRSSQGVLSAG